MEFTLNPSLLLTVLAGFSLATPVCAVVNIDYVMVGNAGNAVDPATGSLYGAVDYAYKIAKNETTISQYAEFLNAVAKTDSYGLYHPNMGSTAIVAGITQNGVSGSFTYSVTAGGGNKPITFVSWFDAARFCNWLHNGQQTGAGAALTAETGAYTLNGATSGIITKNVTATVWIPSESEWYKAAFYDPTKIGGVGGFWQHANQSDSMPTNNIGVAGAANYYDGDYAIFTGSGAGRWVLTDVGAYGPNSDSYYETNDQGGNVREWTDAVEGGQNVLRGGYWYSQNKWELSSFGRTWALPATEGSNIGFRVASVPEPTTLFLTMFAGGVMLIRRRL